MRPKECCNSSCKNVFFVEAHKYLQKNLCDKCVDKAIKKDEAIKTLNL